jgi:hypothetical protein
MGPKPVGIRVADAPMGRRLTVPTLLAGLAVHCRPGRRLLLLRKTSRGMVTPRRALCRHQHRQHPNMHRFLAEVGLAISRLNDVCADVGTNISSGMRMPLSC